MIGGVLSDAVLALPFGFPARGSDGRHVSILQYRNGSLTLHLSGLWSRLAKDDKGL